MLKKVLTFVLIACALTLMACSGDKEDESTTPSATGATPEPSIAYLSGFYDVEKDNANTWRWMSEQGVIKLKNTGTDMKLRVLGNVPVAELKSAPTYKITLNGETLEEFKAEAVDKEYVIPAAKLTGGSSQLVISSSMFFVPKQLDPKSGDERKLSFALRQLTWEAK